MILIVWNEPSDYLVYFLEKCGTDGHHLIFSVISLSREHAFSALPHNRSVNPKQHDSFGKFNWRDQVVNISLIYTPQINSVSLLVLLPLEAQWSMQDLWDWWVLARVGLAQKRFFLLTNYEIEQEQLVMWNFSALKVKQASGNLIDLIFHTTTTLDNEDGI